MTDAILNDLHAEPSKSEDQIAGAKNTDTKLVASGRGVGGFDPSASVQYEETFSKISFVALLKRHEKLVKYFIIGCTASAIDVLLFLILYNVAGTSALVAHSISVPTSVLFSFFVNTRHNFKTNDYLVLRLACFIIVCGIGYVAGYGVIFAAQSIGLDANAGKFLSLPLVFVVQYLLNSRVTFRKFGVSGQPSENT